MAFGQVAFYSLSLGLEFDLSGLSLGVWVWISHEKDLE